MLGKLQTVKQAIDSNIRFDRVSFVNKEYMNKSWMAASHHPTKEELLQNYADNLCQPSVVHDNEGFDKYSLVVYVDPSDPHLQDDFFNRGKNIL